MLVSPEGSHDAIVEPSTDVVATPAVRAKALALLSRGRESAAAGDEAAREQLASAFFFAQAGNEPRVAFEAALALAGEEHDEAQLDEALKWLEHARVLGGSIDSPSAHAHLRLVRALLEEDRVAAREDLETAIELFASDPEADIEELGEAHVRAGRLAHALSQTELARRYFERARELCENEAPRCLAHAVGAQGMLERELGHAEAAVDLLRRATVLQAEALGGDASMTASTRSILGVALTELGRLDEARVELDEAIRVFELPQHRGHPDLATAYETSGFLLETKGDLDGAEQAYQRALATREATIGRDHPYTAVSVMRIASVAYAREDYEGAIRHGTEVQRILTADASGDHILLGPSYGLTADARLRLGQVEAAREDAERAVAALARSDRMPIDLARARFLLARTSWPEPKRRDQAKALAREAEAYLAGTDNTDAQLLAEVRAWRAEHDR
jgi:tetratricopeptide (TPR) repeat protein